MHEFKNVSPGPRGVNTTSGIVLLECDETRSLEVAGSEVAVAKSMGWFVIDGELPPLGDPKELARARGDAARCNFPIGQDWSVDRIRAELARSLAARNLLRMNG